MNNESEPKPESSSLAPEQFSSNLIKLPEGSKERITANDLTQQILGLLGGRPIEDLSTAGVERLAIFTQQLSDLLNKGKLPGESQEGRAELTPEEITVNQKMFDFLQLKNPDGSAIDLGEEYRQGHILLPTEEQKEQAEELGYTRVLIVPGHLKREEIITRANDIYTKGIWFSDDAQAYIDGTKAVLRSNRPEQFYTILLKSELEATQAHPETQNKTPQEAQDILKGLQEEYPELNLQGLTLPEYILLDALVYIQEQRHVDEKDWSYLLAEAIRSNPQDPHSKMARCLSAFFGPVYRQLLVCSDSYANGCRASRLAAVFKKEE